MSARIANFVEQHRAENHQAEHDFLPVALDAGVPHPDRTTAPGRLHFGTQGTLLLGREMAEGYLKTRR